MTNKIANSKQTKKWYRHKRVVTTLVIVVVLMFGFGFALVPLYDVLCKTLGINGKTGDRVLENAASRVVDEKRIVTVEFIATTNTTLPNWQFEPVVAKVDIHPGEEKQVSFLVRNPENETIVVQAIPSVTPGIAAQYLKKTECFCFVQQTLKRQESRKMPLIFHLDPALPKDINTLTLSYTLFKIKKINS